MIRFKGFCRYITNIFVSTYMYIMYLSQNKIYHAHILSGSGAWDAQAQSRTWAFKRDRRRRACPLLWYCEAWCNRARPSCTVTGTGLSTLCIYTNASQNFFYPRHWQSKSYFLLTDTKIVLRGEPYLCLKPIVSLALWFLLIGKYNLNRYRKYYDVTRWRKLAG